jgi:conjugal transfer pilus assembly protein TraV
LRRQLKAAQQKTEAASNASVPNANGAQSDATPREDSDPLPQTSPFSLAVPPDPDSRPDSAIASPLVLPSTAREAIAGAKAPAVEGFDMSPPHDRTPRPLGAAASPRFPSIEAIQAAVAKRTAEKAAATAAPNKDDK